MFFVLCDVIFLVRLQGEFEIDRALGSERVSRACNRTVASKGYVLAQ